MSVCLIKLQSYRNNNKVTIELVNKLKYKINYISLSGCMTILLRPVSLAL